MAEKRNLWAVLVVPWTPNCIYIFGSILLLAMFLPFAAVWIFDRFISTQRPELPDWWLFLPIGLTLAAMIMLLAVGRLLERAARKLPEDPLLRSHCVLVHGILQMPGIAQINGERLTIQPLLGKQISVGLREISDITERRFYNGSPYLGRTTFFRIVLPDALRSKSRFGFAVPDAEPWRKLLLSQ